MIMRPPLFLTLLTLTALPQTAWAVKPITYPGGVTVMNMNDGNSNSLHVLYTFTPRFSAGIKATYDRNDDYGTAMVDTNILLKRWNMPDSQGNLFLNLGAGAAYSDAGDFDSETTPALAGGILADWEDRRYLISYENEYLMAGDIDSSFHQSGRVGIAPYVAEYGALHTWLMLQVDHHPEQDDTLTLTPLVRLFQGDYLGEVGVSDKGKLLLNLNANF